MVNPSRLVVLLGGFFIFGPKYRIVGQISYRWSNIVSLVKYRVVGSTASAQLHRLNCIDSTASTQLHRLKRIGSSVSAQANAYA